MESSSSQWRLMFSRANSAFKNGRYEEAARLYDEAAEGQHQILRQHLQFNRNLADSYADRLQREVSPSYLTTASDAQVAVVLLTTKTTDSAATAELLAIRANHAISVTPLNVERPAAAQPLVSEALRSLTSPYALVVTEDVMPGRDWLRYAYRALRHSGAALVQANTGECGTTQAAWLSVFGRTDSLLALLADRTPGRTVYEPAFVLASSPPAPSQQNPAAGEVHVIEAETIISGGLRFTNPDICVVMPCIDVETGHAAARLLRHRAGIAADFVVAVDNERNGFIPTLNQVARASTARYVVYTAEDALPGEGWLKKAFDAMTRSDKKLLAFNCGKWHGRVAAFGMVERAWAYSLYGNQILYEGYTSHRADNEITAIARSHGEFTYSPDCLLMEYDRAKDFRPSEKDAANFHRADRRLFRRRFEAAFDGLADPRALGELRDEYLDQQKHYAAKAPLIIV